MSFCFRGMARKAVVCVALLAALALPSVAYADDPDLLKVDLASSSQSCVSGEEIELTAVVTNEGDTDAYDASYELNLPDSLVADSISGTLGTIAPGESKELKFAAKAVEPEVSGIVAGAEDSRADALGGDAPATGDFPMAVVAVLAAVFFLAVLGIVLARKKSRHSALLSCFVLAVAVAAAAPVAAFADSVSRTDEGSTSIQVNGESVTACLTVAYLANNGEGDGGSNGSDSGSDDPEEGIVLKPGVVEIQPDHWIELSPTAKTAKVDAEAAELLKDNPVAIFYPGNGDNEGMSMRVSSVTQSGDAYEVSGFEVQLDDVVESINVNGETSDTVGYEIADGVSVEDESDIATQIDLDGEKSVGQLKLKVFDGATVTVSPSIIYSFKYEHGQLEKCKLAVKNEYKADFKWSMKKDFEKKLLTSTFKTSVPGLTVTADLYLVGSASGEVSMEAKVMGTSGIDYSDSKLKMISDTDFSYEASFEALLKTGVKPAAIMKFVGLGLADIDAEVGASVSGALLQRSASFVCADMSAWMYVDVNAGTQKTALAKMMDLLKLKKEYHPLNKSNSPQWNIHSENGKLVQKCTWGEEKVNVEVSHQTIAAGTSCAAVIKKDGSLWTKGDNYYGQLGNSDDSLEKSDEFIKVMDDVRSVDMSEVGCVAIKKDGSLWAWSGDGGNTNLGSGKMSTPVKVADDVANASSGGVFVKEDGSLWKWGVHYNESLGTQTKLADGVRAAKSDFYGIAFLKDDGTVWQMDRKSETIDGAEKIADDVQKIASFDSSTTNAAFLIKEDGSLYSWSFWKGAASLKNEKLDDVVEAWSADGGSYLALRGNGSAMVWGGNHSGVLGTGDEIDLSVPTEILSSVSQISMNWGIGMALKTDGSVYAWGPGWYGDTDSYGGYVVISMTPVKIADGVLVS